MILITKDGSTFKVAETSFKDYYEPFGWKRVKQLEKVEVEHVEEQQEHDEFLKPAREMTDRELRKYAKSLGLNGKYEGREELLQAVLEYQKG